MSGSARGGAVGDGQTIILQLDPLELDVLPGGDVQDPRLTPVWLHAVGKESQLVGVHNVVSPKGPIMN